MWYLQISKLYLCSFGIPVAPEIIKVSPKLFAVYRCACFFIISAYTSLGLFILFTDEHTSSSPWSILHSWIFVMTLLGKCVGPVVVSFMVKDISSTYAMANFMHRHFNSKLSVKKRHWKYNICMLTTVLLYIIFNLTDIFINSIPVTRILQYVKEEYTDDFFLQGTILCLSLPMTTIFYGLLYNFHIMIIDDLYFAGTIFKQLFMDDDRAKTLSDFQEDTIFVVTRHSVVELEDAPQSSSLVRKRTIDKYQVLSRTHHRTSAIHQTIHKIFGDISIWILLCNSVEYPLYILYSFNGVNTTNVSLSVVPFFVVLVALSLAPLSSILTITYKRYITKLKINRQIYSVANSKIRAILREFSNQVSAQYLDSGPLLFEMDSTVLDLMSTFTFLLMTTYLVPNNQ